MSVQSEEKPATFTNQENTNDDPRDQVDPADLVEDSPESDGGGETSALFDARDYSDPRLTLDQIDDKDVDKIRIEFSGSVMLDRKNPEDVALMRGLHLGQSLELRVAATVGSKKHGYTTGKEGDLDAIVYTGGLKVDTVYKLAPEDL